MIILRIGESLRRRYPAELKKFGKGVLYLTTQRIMFESEKHGCVLVFPWDKLYHWTQKKRSLILRWYEQEQPPKTDYERRDTFVPVGDIGSAEFKFGKKNGRKCDLQEIHLSLFCAVTDFYTYGNRGNGFYRDQAGKLRNHFFNRQGIERDIERTSKGMLMTLSEIMTVISLGHLRNATGENLIDQDLMSYYKKHEAWAFDGRIDDHTFAPSSWGQKEEHETFRGCGPVETHCRSAEANVRCGKEYVKYLEDEIRQLESEGNTGKLEEYIEPYKKTRGRAAFYLFKGGNKYDYLKFSKERLAIYQRAFDIVSRMTFVGQRQDGDYYVAVCKAITEKFERDGDIANYTPDVKLREEKTSKVPRILAEYRKKLTETA